MSKSMIIGCLVLFLFAVLIDKSDSAPYQILPTREGYVPVYIRLGDTPLNDINPELAIAFHEVGANGRQLKSDDGFSNSAERNENVPAGHETSKKATVKVISNESVQSVEPAE